VPWPTGSIKLAATVGSGKDEGQVVLISGEPGIGKSRFTAALMELLAGKPYT
jgi:predicted ATP-dependent serine protease